MPVRRRLIGNLRRRDRPAGASLNRPGVAVCIPGLHLCLRGSDQLIPAGNPVYGRLYGGHTVHAGADHQRDPGSAGPRRTVHREKDRGMSVHPAQCGADCSCWEEALSSCSTLRLITLCTTSRRLDKLGKESGGGFIFLP